MSTKVVTIERFILDHQPAEAGGDLTGLLYDLALAAKIISHKINRAGLLDIIGAAGATNVQGEAQQKLDVYADDVIHRLCGHTGRLCVMASEENEGIIPIPEEYPKGKYVLVYDPLDGSSNIDVNVSIGTVFSVFRAVDLDRRGRLEDCLQPGRSLVCAGYVLYGSSTMMVYSTGDGVHGFTLDPDIGEFLLSHPNMSFPAQAHCYSANHAYFSHWPEGAKAFVRWLQGEDLPRMTERYTGSLVADFHRNLLLGGVFIYPADRKNPRGKLRLLYEAAPLAFLAEQARGYASNGHGSILEIVPQELHERTPFIVGNRSLVEKAEQLIRQGGKGAAH
jgi:fructose-1,6-bisphosphatase I